MKVNHIILIVIMFFVSSSCSIKTIEVIVEDEARFKPDVYDYTITIMDENLAKLLSQNPLSNTGKGKNLLSLEKLENIIVHMDEIEIYQDQGEITNGLIEEGIELSILSIKGENGLKNLTTELDDYSNFIGRISRAKLLDEAEKEKNLIKALLNKAKQKAEFIASEQNMSLGEVIKIEDVGETADRPQTYIKENQKKKKRSKIEPTGFEVLKEKFIEDIDTPRLDRDGNIVLKKTMKVTYKISKK